MYCSFGAIAVLAIGQKTVVLGQLLINYWRDRRPRRAAFFAIELDAAKEENEIKLEEKHLHWNELQLHGEYPLVITTDPSLSANCELTIIDLC